MEPFNRARLPNCDDQAAARLRAAWIDHFGQHPYMSFIISHKECYTHEGDSPWRHNSALFYNVLDAGFSRLIVATEQDLLSHRAGLLKEGEAIRPHDLRYGTSAVEHPHDFVFLHAGKPQVLKARFDAPPPIRFLLLHPHDVDRMPGQTVKYDMIVDDLKPLFDYATHALFYEESNSREVSFRVLKDPKPSVPFLELPDLTQGDVVCDHTCVECGIRENSVRWPRDSVRRLSDLGVCYNCGYWREKVEKRNEPESARVDGVQYWVRPQPKVLQTHTVFVFDDGRVVTSEQYGINGKIPLRFRDRLPDNATRRDGTWQASEKQGGYVFYA
jgi:hypothetical protein